MVLKHFGILSNENIVICVGDLTVNEDATILIEIIIGEGTNQSVARFVGLHRVYGYCVVVIQDEPAVSIGSGTAGNGYGEGSILHRGLHLIVLRLGTDSQLVAQRDAGHAVLLVSLELEEVLSVSDRILVMYEGELVGEFDPRKTSREELGMYMSGAKRKEVSA